MRFPNPPITEAIFDITVNLRDDFHYEDLLTFQEDIKESFPNVKNKMAIQGAFEFNLENPEEINPQLFSNQPEGYIFVSNDQKRIIQAKLHGFTFSKLRPYQSWKDFYGEAYQLWQKYIEITCPLKVVRLALRYVNQIIIPVPKEGVIELKDYIKTLPEIPNDLSVAIEGYFMQLVLNHTQYQPSRAIINQTIGQMIENDEGNKAYPLIFDIDVFQEVNLSLDDQAIKNIFEANLKCFREDIFFKSITEKTKELFQ